VKWAKLHINPPVAVNFSDGKTEALYGSQDESSLFYINWGPFSTLQVRLLIPYQAGRHNAANALNLLKTLFLGPPLD
jgi:hypothetical protein